MSGRTITVEIDGTTYSAKLGRINSTQLGSMDGRFGVAGLDCRFDGTGQMVGGGIVIDGKPKAPGGERTPTLFAWAMVAGILRTVGVDKWEELPGKHVLALYAEGDTWGMAVGLAHIVDESKVLIFEHLVQEYITQEGSS